MGAGPAALTPAEIPIGGRGAALSGGHAVAVHGHAHRAARADPFQPCRGENLVQPFGLCLGFHARRAGRYQPGHLRLTALQNSGSGAQVFDPRIGAGSNENLIDRDVLQALARIKAHIV